MFLDVEGMTLPEFAAVHTVTDNPKFEEWQGGRPKWLCTLGASLWPDAVKKKIAAIYKAVGIPDPMKQKLVEPYAIIFGGQNKDGSFDYSKVDWDLAADYFEWEAAAVTLNEEKSNALQGQAEKKHGFMFSHYPVYQDYTSREGFI